MLPHKMPKFMCVSGLASVWLAFKEKNKRNCRNSGVSVVLDMRRWFAFCHKSCPRKVTRRSHTECNSTSCNHRFVFQAFLLAEFVFPPSKKKDGTGFPVGFPVTQHQQWYQTQMTPAGLCLKKVARASQVNLNTGVFHFLFFV